MYYVYVLRHSDKSFYIGYTSDLKRRIAQHRMKKRSVKLCYYEAYQSGSDARQREGKLKEHGNAWRGLRRRITESIELPQ